jgi:hypothetical protein
MRIWKGTIDKSFERMSGDEVFIMLGLSFDEVQWSEEWQHRWLITSTVVVSGFPQTGELCAWLKCTWLKRLKELKPRFTDQFILGKRGDNFESASNAIETNDLQRVSTDRDGKILTLPEPNLDLEHWILWLFDWRLQLNSPRLSFLALDPGLIHQTYSRAQSDLRENEPPSFGSSGPRRGRSGIEG